MSLPSCLFCDTVPVIAHNTMLILNSASDPFMQRITQSGTRQKLLLAEDNIAAAKAVEVSLRDNKTALQHVAFHDFILHQQPGTVDVAVMNLLYQSGTAWIVHGLQLAAYALRPGGRLYVTGAKERGILSTTKRMQSIFGNVETLLISKGQRVVCSQKLPDPPLLEPIQDVTVFASSKLDDGTRQLLSVLEVHATDEALDIGCGAGFLGLHIAHLATQGYVTMVDVSLAAVTVAQQAIEQSGLTNIRVLASDGSEAVSKQRFDLVVTNPPFHMGGIQTLEIAERFIREAAQVLRPQGRFYLVANRFLKYEPVLHAHFQHVEEVGGDTRFKVMRAQLI
jgi:16S rRNA (guanine1207-N2)-methyltransferase